MDNRHSFFDPSQETFTKIYPRNGYKTGIPEKWHLSSSSDTPANPDTAGFDYFLFKKGAGCPYYNPNGYIQPRY